MTILSIELKHIPFDLCPSNARVFPVCYVHSQGSRQQVTWQASPDPSLCVFTGFGPVQDVCDGISFVHISNHGSLSRLGRGVL